MSLLCISRLSCIDVYITDVLIICLRDSDSHPTLPKVLLSVKVPDENVTFDSHEVRALRPHALAGLHELRTYTIASEIGRNYHQQQRRRLVHPVHLSS